MSARATGCCANGDAPSQQPGWSLGDVQQSFETDADERDRAAGRILSAQAAAASARIHALLRAIPGAAPALMIEGASSEVVAAWNRIGATVMAGAPTLASGGLLIDGEERIGVKTGAAARWWNTTAR